MDGKFKEQHVYNLFNIVKLNLFMTTGIAIIQFYPRFVPYFFNLKYSPIIEATWT